LRKIALAKAEGTLLGSEDDLIALLGVSRVTVRQTARLLEREGVLMVRRGLNGGYFSARPSDEMVVSIVCTYLTTMGLDARYSGKVTAALWIETLREATLADREGARVLQEQFAGRFSGLPDNTRIEDIAALELEFRSAVLTLIGGEYIGLLMRINTAFSRMEVLEQIDREGRPDYREEDWHRLFVRRWKKAKMMELEAIGDGDAALAMMAGRHARLVWDERRAGERLAHGENAPVTSGT
jgi:DNA-binding GntR family transcriptional regulator